VKKYVFTPGPVPVPSEVLIEMAKPIIHHRTAEFEEIFAKVREGLKYIYDNYQVVLCRFFDQYLSIGSYYQGCLGTIQGVHSYTS